MHHDRELRVSGRDNLLTQLLHRSAFTNQSTR
ncbi:Uncharacterised protein [Vibrio cholerae]|nr:Uncharacterised protein [Vibrio cholerae]